MSFKPEMIEAAARAEFEAFMESAEGIPTVSKGFPPKMCLTWDDMSEGIKETWRDGVHRPQRGDAVEQWLIVKIADSRWDSDDEYAYCKLLKEYQRRADLELLLHEELPGGE